MVVARTLGYAETAIELLRSLLAVEPPVLRSRVVSALEVDASLFLSAISVPVLYLQATQDRLLSRSVGARIFATIPNVEVVEIVGPHLLLQCAFEACAEAVARFAARIKMNT